MKPIAHFLTTASLIIGLSASSQAQDDFVTSRIRVSTETGVIISDNASAIIKLNTHSQELNVSSCILLSINDSVTGKSNQTSLTIDFTGQFPIENLDFYDVANDKNIHIASGELTVNQVNRPYKMNFGLHGPSSINVYSQDKRSYSARINFAIEVNAADFNLGDIPASFAKTIILGIKDGVINKTDEYNIGPECVGTINDR